MVIDGEGPNMKYVKYGDILLVLADMETFYSSYWKPQFFLLQTAINRKVNYPVTLFRWQGRGECPLRRELRSGKSRIHSWQTRNGFGRIQRQPRKDISYRHPYRVPFL